MLMSHVIAAQLKIAVFISLFCVYSQMALAVDVPIDTWRDTGTSLYAVEVLVADESADIRWRVFKEGLDEVFIRIAGDSIIMDTLKRPSASRYVKQYSYVPIDPPVISEQGEVLSYRLKIQYNGSAMAKYLRDNGFPVWGEHRTDVVVWLAVRDGRNEYVLKEGDLSLLKSSAEHALLRRGIPHRWPLFDAKDQKILKVADIRGGFEDPILMASKRYSHGPALAGSLSWNGEKWQSSWSLLMASGHKHWNIEDTDFKLLLNNAIDQAADAMGVVFAIHSTLNNQQRVTVQLRVQAVHSIERYRQLENYLRGLSAVETAMPLMVDGENATFEITLRSSKADFLKLIKNDGELLAATPPAEHVAAVIPVAETSVVLDEGNDQMVISNIASDQQDVNDSDKGAVSNQQISSQEIPSQNSMEQPIAQPPTVEQAPPTALYHYKLNY